MANTTLFSSIKSKLPRTDTINEAGGRAYEFTPKHALAQMAATGCFNGVFYSSAQSQLDEMRQLIAQVDDNVFLAKLAVYARERAYMKDMPAALLVVLSKRDTQLLHQVFDRVVDNGRVLRTMFQMIRSGQLGRTRLSSSLQRAFQRWLNKASVDKLLSASIGSNPSLRDVLRMARPMPKDNARRALFGWLTAYLNADESVPQKIKAALHQAAEIACGNVPELPGPVVIGLDTSGSWARRPRVSAPGVQPARCVVWTPRRCSRRRSCDGTLTASSSRSTRRPTRRRLIRGTRS